MTPLDRRSFLAALLASPAAGDLLDGARTLRLQDPQPGAQFPSRSQQLRAAVVSAREQGKPLLVLAVVAPAPLDLGGPVFPAAVDRFGRWLLDGDAASRRELASTVLAVATVAEVEAVLGWQGGGKEALLVVAPAATPPVTAAGTEPPIACAITPVDARLLFAAPRDGAFDWPAVDAELAAALVRAGLALDVLARRVHGRLAPEQRERLTRWLATGRDEPPAELLLRAAPWIRCALTTVAAERRGVLGASFDAALYGALVQRRPAGAQWANARGCGSAIDPTDEHEPQWIISCGRGSIPDTARRFLVLYCSG
jgi:hypothetical protein